MAGADKEKRINFKMVLAIAVVITAVTAGRTVNLACTGFAPNADTLTIHNKIHPIIKVLNVNIIWQYIS